MSTEPDNEPQYGPEAPDDPSLAQLVVDVTSQASTLIREEIELAKTEVTEKVTSLIRGSIVAIVAGIFVLLGFVMLMHSFAWLLNDLFFEDDVWLGFLVEALIWFVIAAVAGFWAYKSLKAGAPPVPEMAIEEAKRIQQTLAGETPETPETPKPPKTEESQS